jgi:hypothetical protein
VHLLAFLPYIHTDFVTDHPSQAVHFFNSFPSTYARLFFYMHLTFGQRREPTFKVVIIRFFFKDEAEEFSIPASHLRKLSPAADNRSALFALSTYLQHHYYYLTTSPRWLMRLHTAQQSRRRVRQSFPYEYRGQDHCLPSMFEIHFFLPFFFGNSCSILATMQFRSTGVMGINPRFTHTNY